jgi:2,3-bisphosphoglycerate-independent phosphoglycerate mutase
MSLQSGWTRRESSNVTLPKLKKLRVCIPHLPLDVTFFFNGGTEQSFSLEERDLIDSPRVATYDLQPEMSALAVANKVAERVIAKEHPFVLW